MKKEEKLKIIKWYIQNYCGFYDSSLVQTEDLSQLESIVRNDRLHEYNSTCSSCYWGGHDHARKCRRCIYAAHGSHEIDGYTFPYAYLKQWMRED
ncbi:MAG: hypothetical protein IJ137_04455 [Eubacterium sp.]|nr:hypothetical protein [Eubacterium sp.]